MKIIECPRDAMQGIHTYIPSPVKAEFINTLLKVGFDIIDFGSFVSPKAIPQLKDTSEVLDRLDMSKTKSRLLSIVGNSRGGSMASNFDKISYIGFPWSVSSRFLELNINSNPEKSLKTIGELIDICHHTNKTLVVYISMAYGNHYGEEWHEDKLYKGVEELKQLGVEMISISDTVGMGTAQVIGTTIKNLISDHPEIDFGLHLHSTLHNWYDKVDAAYNAGCRQFDGVINGLGGCPMAGHDLVGNINTQLLIDYCNKNGISNGVKQEAFEEALAKAVTTFSFLDLEN